MIGSTSAARKHAGSAPPTPLVGRDAELAELAWRLAPGVARLITLTGPGGVGKTRLALAFIETLHHASRAEFVFVDLSTLRDPGRVPATIAAALGVPETGERPQWERALAVLRSRELLLVVDNFEQVLPAAPAVSDLLAAGPEVRVLVTSRVPLRLLGEHVFLVAPLALPDPGRAGDLGAAAASPAVQLFVQRAQACDRRFQLTTSNAPAVAAICTRLDGLPLAIELAAVSSRLLPPAVLLARLDDALGLLVGGPRDAASRHQTLRGTLDWSYDLLGADEQRLFAWLGVFAGSFSLEAAEAICTDDHAERSVLARLGVLLDHSLVQRVAGTDAMPRFGLLVTIREFALDRLAASGQTPTVQLRHLAFYVALAEQAEAALWGPQRRAWLDRLEQEHDNLRTALRWALQAQRLDEALRLSVALAPFWEGSGHVVEGSDWLEQVLGQPGPADLRLRARALGRAGDLARNRADYRKAVALHSAAQAAWESLGDRLEATRAQTKLGVMARDQGDHAGATRLCTETLAVFRELHDRKGMALALFSLGVAARMGGEPDRAEHLLSASRALFSALDDQLDLAWVQYHRGQAALDRGDRQTARALFEDALRAHEAVGSAWGSAMAMSGLGLVAGAEGNLAEALRRHQNSLERRRALGVHMRAADTLEHVAWTLLQLHQPEAAARLFGAAAALRARLGTARALTDQRMVGATLSSIRASLGAAAFSRAYAAGCGATLDEIVAEVLALRTTDMPARVGRPVVLDEVAARQLTRREREVATLIAQGTSSNRQLAAALTISERTAGLHVERILKKLALHSRAQLAAWAAEQALERPDST